MGLYHIISNYLKQNPKDDASDLAGTYIYFKFKAYLQITLIQTQKAYSIKTWKAAAKLRYMSPDDICERFESIPIIGVDDLRYDIRQAMKLLNPAQIKIISLYFYREKTDQEISSIMQITRQTVIRLKRQALSKLKYFLKEYA
ncbi:MAG: hypothetical protein LBU70_09365 [Chitinispirillales bacterium]|nr:hypothetical protein [Chitinispirillales bacterium]